MSIVNAGQWHNVLRHLPFSERTRKIDGRHLMATQGTTQSHNTIMPETVVRVRTTRWGQSDITVFDEFPNLTGAPHLAEYTCPKYTIRSLLRFFVQFCNGPWLSDCRIQVRPLQMSWFSFSILYEPLQRYKLNSGRRQAALQRQQINMKHFLVPTFCDMGIA